MRQVHGFELEQNSPILVATSCERLSTAFPLEPVVLRHSLADHPLLSPEMLALAAARMQRDHVECRHSGDATGQGFGHATGLDPSEVIRRIDEAGRWVMLRFAEQLPEYAALLDQVLGQIEPAIAGYGRPLSPHAFIFVSSPGTLTPLHFDPEFNLLLQIAGTKRFVTHPVRAPWLDDATQSRYHRDGDNLLAWDSAYSSAGTVHTLTPGDALFVPYKAPHWVEVADEPSVSLSLTWSCEATQELEAAWQLHGWLRETGVKIKAPPAFPGRAPLGAGLRRGLGKLGLV